MFSGQCVTKLALCNTKLSTPARFPCLACVSFRGISVSYADLQMLGQLSTLCNLSFQMVTIGDTEPPPFSFSTDTKKILPGLAHLTRLTYLSMSWIDTQQKQLDRQDFSGLPLLTNLCSLTLRCGEDLDLCWVSGLSQVQWEAFSSLSCLTSLHVDVVYPGMSSIPNLQTLDIGCIGQSWPLPHGCSALSSLTKLEASGVNVVDCQQLESLGMLSALDHLVFLGPCSEMINFFHRTGRSYHA